MPVHPIAWKAVASLVVVGLLCQQFGLFRRPVRSREQLQHDRVATSLALSKTPDYIGWTYNWARDRDSYDLASWQCDAAFPDLYQDIDRAVQHWQGRNITQDTIELPRGNEAGVQLLVHNQQLRIVHTKGMARGDFRARMNAVLHQLHRAITSVEETDEPFPDMEFTIALDDIPTLPKSGNHTVWSFTRALNHALHDDVWLIPDYHFWAAPPESRRFPEMQAKAREHDAELVDKTPQVAWRGVKWTAPKIRGALLNVTRGQYWADVKTIRWQDKSNYMALDDFCDYRFLVNTEGRSWSSRLTYLLNCDSVPIVHDRTWTAHYYHLLQPNVNFIPVSGDFSDLGEKIHHFLWDTDAAQQIADNARTTFRERYTTAAASACYWRKLLRSWSSVAFEPEVYKATSVMYDDITPRGIAFVDFLHADLKKDYHDD